MCRVIHEKDRAFVFVGEVNIYFEFVDVRGRQCVVGMAERALLTVQEKIKYEYMRNNL